MLAFALVSFALAPGGEFFERPFRLQDAQGWIDVDQGMAAPHVADFDGDGLPDLLVGQHGDGKLRIYKNVGSAKAPRFDGFSWFKTGEQEGRVPVDCAIGFGPRFADLDGDGIKDVVSGSDRRGDVYLFRGLGRGAYATGTILRTLDGQPARPLCASSVSVADWNGDGKLDLVVGDREGKVALFAGLGSRDGAPAFDKPRPFALDESEPAPHGNAAPLVVDWDRDGIDDLLVGYGWGPVVFYKGVLENAVRAVLAGEILLQPCYEDEPETLAISEVSGKLEPAVGRAHKLPKLAVWDWNGDGSLDLLVGDSFSATGPEPLLTAEQHNQRDELLRLQSALAQKLADARRPLREQMEKELGPREKFKAGWDVWQDQVDERLAELVSQSQDCRTIQRELDEVTTRFRALSAPRVSHGYVWVYLRK